jgi:pimeloyl-ACP methyl ester carboxylesterase
MALYHCAKSGETKMRRFFKWLMITLVVLMVGTIAVFWESDRDAAAMKAKYASATSQFIDIGGGMKIHARDEGKRDGRVMVLIHGSNSSLHTWEPWVQRLGGQYRVISMDMPGHGLTGPNPARDYHYAVFIDVVDKVMTKMGVAKFTIAGNSMGGGIAWHYAVAHPDRVEGLVLVDAAGAPQWQAKKVPIGFKLARMPVVKELARYVTPRSVFESSLHASVSNQAIVTPQAVDRYFDLNLYPGNRQATMDRFALVHNVEPADKAALGAIKVPTLIMWGDEDGLIPVGNAKWFADMIPGSKSVIYPKIGHLPMEEVADQSAADMGAFMAGLPKP